MMDKFEQIYLETLKKVSSRPIQSEATIFSKNGQQRLWNNGSVFGWKGTNSDWSTAKNIKNELTVEGPEGSIFEGYEFRIRPIAYLDSKNNFLDWDIMFPSEVSNLHEDIMNFLNKSGKSREGSREGLEVVLKEFKEVLAEKEEETHEITDFIKQNLNSEESEESEE